MAFIRACIDNCGHSVGLRLGVYTRERDNDGGIYYYIVYTAMDSAAVKGNGRKHTHFNTYIYIILLIISFESS